MKIRWIVPVVVALAMFVGNGAVADVAPPDDYVETCTLEQQHFDDTECFLCVRDMISGPDEQVENQCEEDTIYETDGYDKACSSWGGSIWNEIWCRPSPGTEGPAGDPSESNDDEDASCSVIHAGSSASAGLFLLFGMLLAALLIRRSTR